jgi:glycerol-3-phosphate acyltransferase PlsX
LLVGQEDVVRPLVSAASSPVEVVHAPDVIDMAEHATDSVRGKPEASINVAVDLVKAGRAQAFVSAGNTGACMTAALLGLGRVPGIDRPALAGVFPTRNRKLICLVDVGANADCRPHHILQFGAMGAAFMERVFKLQSPRVGLLNIGEEESKGNQLALEAYELFRESSLNFVGNIDGKDLMRNLADVVATDGFTGNVALKASEGAAEYVLSELRGVLTAGLLNKAAAAVLKPSLMKLRSKIDYAETGGANLLGVRGVVVVAHGRSDARAILSAIRIARDAVRADLIPALEAVGEATRRRRGPQGEGAADSLNAGAAEVS